MFNAVVIASNPSRCQSVRNAAAETGKVVVLRELEDYPTGPALARLLNTTEPDLLLLDFDAPEMALECLSLAVSLRTTCVLALGPETAIDSAARDPRVAATVAFPPDVGTLMKAIDEAIHHGRAPVEKNLLAFLPAKAGSGASTIVFNTAVALRKLNRKVLVIEADLRSGVLSFMLNVTPGHSIQSLLWGAGEMDRFRVYNAVTKALDIDFLLSNRTWKGRFPLWDDYFRLLEAVKAHYDDVLVDLPELVNSGTREIVQRSRLVFPVSTPELLQLKLAQHRVQELLEWGVPEDRIRILLNRWHGGEAKPEDIGLLLRYPLDKVFPNDYPTLRAATLAGRPLPADSPLGTAFAEFALALTGAPVSPSEGSLSSRLRGLFRRNCTT